MSFSPIALVKPQLVPAKILLGICTHEKGFNRQQRQRLSFLLDLDKIKSIDYLFFRGGSERLELRADTLWMPCSDSEDHLSVKTAMLLRWALENHTFDYLMKCEDDTYVDLRRLYAFDLKGRDYIGHDMGGFASGGAGYLLSRRAVELISQSVIDHPPTRAEDVVISECLRTHGITVSHSDKFQPYREPGKTPSSSNDVITGHCYLYNNQIRETREQFISETEFRRPRHRPPRALTLRKEKKKITWVFEYEWDYQMVVKGLLPHLDEGFERCEGGGDEVATIGVCITNLPLFFDMASGYKFLIGGEAEDRYERWEKCYTFVQDPRPEDDWSYVRYAPPMTLWAPPTSIPKSRKCSAIEGGKYEWRVKETERLAGLIGGVDTFGNYCGRPLSGYHSVGVGEVPNEKRIGLQTHAFTIAIERRQAPDYLTEKATDPIYCETVPIYQGCPNISDYLLEGSYILTSEVENIDWNDWVLEYEKRRPYVLKQKQLLLSSLNVISYFDRLLDNMHLLSRPRPITLVDMLRH
jgi:hypothetical protein